MKIVLTRAATPLFYEIIISVSLELGRNFVSTLLNINKHVGISALKNYVFLYAC